jgi:hypothetical protein
MYARRDVRTMRGSAQRILKVGQNLFAWRRSLRETGDERRGQTGKEAGAVRRKARGKSGVVQAQDAVVAQKDVVPHVKRVTTGCPRPKGPLGRGAVLPPAERFAICRGRRRPGGPGQQGRVRGVAAHPTDADVSDLQGRRPSAALHCWAAQRYDWSGKGMNSRPAI